MQWCNTLTVCYHATKAEVNYDSPAVTHSISHVFHCSLFWRADTLTFLKGTRIIIQMINCHTDRHSFMIHWRAGLKRLCIPSQCLLKRAKTNRSENKSSIAHQRCRAQQNNLSILIDELHNPTWQNHVLFRKTTNQVISLQKAIYSSFGNWIHNL
jgi:hypothetical protein